ncbi:MAG: amidase, partial [Chitinophagaceae bacterium]|nr:amidase [Rubrivivax sp.]
HASDGGGSIRTPAHCCGVFGLKPSRGRNPVGPQQFGGPFGYGVHHVSTRSVRDSAAFLDVLHGDEPGAWYRAPPPARHFAQEVGADPGRLRIAFSSASPSPFATSPECVAAVEEAARLFESLGHHVEEAAPCYDWEAFRSAFNDNWVAGVPYRIAHLESLLGFRIGPEHLEPCNWVNLQYARSMTLEHHQRSMARLSALTREVESFFQHWDVLLTPVNRGPANRLGVLSPDLAFEGTLGYWDRICAGVGPYLPIFNANGQPAMSVPFTTSAEGLPIGIHCVTRFGDEAALLRLASQIESARPWAHRRPPVHVADPATQGPAVL